jgi:hypothetical protein
LSTPSGADFVCGVLMVRQEVTWRTAAGGKTAVVGGGSAASFFVRYRRLGTAYDSGWLSMDALCRVAPFDM